MLNRTLFIALLLMAFTLQLEAQNTVSKGKQPVDLVYPQLGTELCRWFYFSSAARPFGMVSLYPDTKNDQDWGAGYQYNIDTIRNFTHIHEWQLSGVALLPVTFNQTDLPVLFSNYASPFSHKKEMVRPGFHSVVLDRYNIKAALTSSNRVGVHKYEFRAGKQKGVLFELGGQLGPSKMTEGGFELVGKNEIRGYTVNGVTPRRPKPYPVYFSAVFDQPIKRVYLYDKGTVTNDVKKWNGKDGKILVELADATIKPLLMKVGVSFTSEAGAENNIQKEVPHWDFDRVATEARQEWNDMLGRIQIEGGTEKEQRRFYTDLWHAIQGRRMINDADGRYADFTGLERLVKQVPLDRLGKPLFNMYNSDSFWGAEWTLTTLWSLVYPEVVNDFCNSFLEYYKNGGLIPRGPAGGNYTYVMTGDQMSPFYVSAYQKGIRGFDINLAYEGLRKNHFPGGMMSKIGYEHKTAKGGGLEYYMERGYVPFPLSDTTFGYHQDGGAITLENAYQDWCLAQLSKALNKTEDYNYFMKRSENYRNLYNAGVGFMVPKNRQGQWKQPYDVLAYDNGFEEGNSAQWTWFVPHNPAGLFELMGGKDSAIKKLNRQFELSQPYRFSEEHPESKKLLGRREHTWINYSNQPSIQTAFLFNYAGASHLTQKWSRLVVDSAYSDLSPTAGYNGDEDQGLMGSLSVLMKIGLFQMTGGCERDPRYEIGSPIFKKITISLNPKYYQAKSFVIETKNNSPKNMYVKSVLLNGKKLNTFYFNHSDINKGSTVFLEMSSKP